VTVNGDKRVGLFALKNIPKASELTFNYQVNTFINMVILNIFNFFSLKELEKLKRSVCVGQQTDLV
jgi:hypothetical protein